MTKIKMPEPVASRFIEKNHYAAGKNWVYCDPFNPQQDWTKKAQNNYYVMQLYSAFQMEDYKDACVREALEEVLKLFGDMPDKGSGLMWTVLANQIRALMPKEE